MSHPILECVLKRRDHFAKAVSHYSLRLSEDMIHSCRVSSAQGVPQRLLLVRYSHILTLVPNSIFDDRGVEVVR